MASNGLGVSILPDWAQPWPEGVRLSLLPLPGKPVHREIGLLWPRSTPFKSLLDVVLDTLLQERPAP